MHVLIVILNSNHCYQASTALRLEKNLISVFMSDFVLLKVFMNSKATHSEQLFNLIAA
jgi:hypothetical protein